MLAEAKGRAVTWITSCVGATGKCLGQLTGTPAHSLHPLPSSIPAHSICA
jgi:hypothetical protein